MRSDARTTTGIAARSAEISRLAGPVLLAMLLGCPVYGQSLYKYRGPDGEWMFTDRPPEDESLSAEIRALPQGQDQPEIEIRREIVDGQPTLTANNKMYAPVELALIFDGSHAEGPSGQEQIRRFLLEPRTTIELPPDLVATGNADAKTVRYVWVPGDPQAEHRPRRAYRAPFAIARQHRISQAYPDVVTHVTRDSMYAIDISMPIGTDIYAARGGTVVEVASSNYRGGFDTSRDGAKANLVRVLHEDGTFAVYAHLHWNSIRVRPGDKVVRGEYIADSGNTGFSSGPHLHFVVVKNTGMAVEAVPIEFEGRNSSTVSPALGDTLTAY